MHGDCTLNRQSWGGVSWAYTRCSLNSCQTLLLARMFEVQSARIRRFFASHHKVLAKMPTVLTS